MRAVGADTRRAAAARTAVLAVAGAVLLSQLGRLIVLESRLAIAVTVTCVAVVAIVVAPAAILVAAVPAVFALWRVSPGPVDMSVSDAVLIVASVAGIGTVDWRNRHLRRMLMAVGAYQSILLVCVVVEPTSRAVVEWCHRGLLLGGGVLVGTALAQRGLLPYALKALALVAGAVAMVAVGLSLTSALAPAYPLGLHKNAAGALLSMVLLLAYIAPGALSRSGTAVLVLRVTLVGGIMATQSRGAMLALVIGFATWAVRRPAAVLRLPLLVVACVAMVTFVVVSLARPEEREGAFTPLGSRERQREEALVDWRTSPVVGQGIRYFRAPEYAGRQEVHNVVYATLAETGVVGLVALVIFFGWTLVVVRGIRGALGTAALAVVVARFAHGLFDLFWGAGTQTLPWLLIGMAAGSLVSRASRGSGRRGARPEHGLEPREEVEAAR